ncbi:uncharacterized protein YneR [Scopulibacillus darangshiensis]|uniref:Uncharacterized protein YneR n=1 Tax=Scopulibacillus darangshiensis TaxID=442528 RepID=A0A4R2P5Y6_9BACL|nr:hypothetical protein [Scopulibacillus darangshiensis]TCP30232.1 uncharacterized protein YneR [Scopulibacillus darangshiensis]
MLQISKQAARFYKDEMALQDGDGLKLYVRYGGYDEGGFALGVEKALPTELDTKTNIEGITFFSCPDDLWFTSNIVLDFDDECSDLKLSYTA